MLYSVLHSLFARQYLHRLSPPPPGSGDILEHRRLTWDTISIRLSRPALLTGVGVFAPQGGGSESLVCVDARPLVEPLRELDVATKLESEFFMKEGGEVDKNRITIFSKVNPRPQNGACYFGYDSFSRKKNLLNSRSATYNVQNELYLTNNSNLFPLAEALPSHA